MILQTILRKFPPINEEVGYHIGKPFSLYNMFLSPWVENQPIGFHVATGFLIGLFLVEIYNIILQWMCSKLKIENEWIVLGITLLISLIGIHFIQNDATVFLKIASRFMYCLFFFRLGHWDKVFGEGKD